MSTKLEREQKIKTEITKQVKELQNALQDKSNYHKNEFAASRVTKKETEE